MKKPLVERLWAPWRMTYITSGQTEPGCFLCRAWKAGDPASHRVLHKGERAFVIMNLYPYNNGHLMVALAGHVGDLAAAGPEARAELMELTSLSVGALREAFSPDAFNVGVNLGKAAGAGVEDHLHVHVVPRWNGDTNFMPVLSDVKVVSEHIDATFEKLKPLFDRLKHQVKP
jgi:ATP adenylyltransferase